MYKIKKEALIIKKFREEGPKKIETDEVGKPVEKENQPCVKLTEGHGSMAEFRPRMDSGRGRQMDIWSHINKDVWGRGYAPSSDTCCDCLFACLMRLFVSLLEGNQCLHICLKGFRARIVDISSPFFVEPVCVA